MISIYIYLRIFFRFWKRLYLCLAILYTFLPYSLLNIIIGIYSYSHPSVMPIHSIIRLICMLFYVILHILHSCTCFLIHFCTSIYFPLNYIYIYIYNYKLIIIKIAIEFNTLNPSTKMNSETEDPIEGISKIFPVHYNT